MDNKELTRIFSYAGKKKGYDSVTAVFEPHTDFKIEWARTYRWVEFKVSDYLDEAPMEAMHAMADVMFMRICGERTKYPKELNAYLLSQEFRDAKINVWLDRKKAKETPGLQEHVEKLMEAKGLELEGLKAYQGPKPAHSPIFKAVVIPRQTPDKAIVEMIQNTIDSMKMFEN